MKDVLKYFVNIPLLFFLLTACAGKNKTVASDSIAVADTKVGTIAADNKKEVAEDLTAYTGDYQSICDLDTTVHLMQLSVFKKENSIYISYDYPDKHLSLKGKVTKDTINFEPKFNVWTINDKNGLVYGFLFNKEDDQPTIRLLNEDSKPIFESSKCAIGKEIIFKKVRSNF